MIEIGRLCVKTAGRDAGLNCIVVDQVNDKLVLIDGQTRRRKCNIAHLEPAKEVLKISKGASHEDVVKAFLAAKIEIKERKSKPKTERPRKQRKVKEKKEQPKEEKKKIEKKEEKPLATKKEEAKKVEKEVKKQEEAKK